MAGGLNERNSVREYYCVAAGTSADKAWFEKYHTVEDLQAADVDYEQEKSHVGEEGPAAEVHAVVIGNFAVRIGADSRFVLVEADEIVAAGIVALAGFVGFADTVELSGLVEIADFAVSVDLAVRADNAVLHVVGSVENVAQ